MLPRIVPFGLVVVSLPGLMAIGCSGGGGGGGGGGAPQCPTPTAAQCKSAAWLTTDACGIAERDAMRSNPQSTCNQVVTAETEVATADIQPETVVLPDSLGGGTAQAKVVPNPEAGPSEISMPLTALGAAQQSAMNASETGLSPQDQALRDAWTANGGRVISCREYAYERYYDYSRFQDATAARHDDPSAIARVAFGPATEPTAIGTHVASGGTLEVAPPWYDPMPVQTLPARPFYPIADCAPSYGPEGTEYYVPNIFYALPLNVFRQVEAQLTPADTSLSMMMQYSRCYERVAPLAPSAAWQWHKDHHDLAVLEQGITLAEREALQVKAKAFRQALEDLDRLKADEQVNRCCAVGAACCATYQAARTSLETRLGELFVEAHAAGCVKGLPGQATVCDWSPSYFVESLRGSFDPQIEHDYQRCLDLVPDPEDFTALASKTFRNYDGSYWQGRYWPTDYTVSTVMVESYFADQEAWLGSYVASLPADVKDPITGSPRAPEVQRGANHRAGNAVFGAGYDYVLRWKVPIDAPAAGQAKCALGLEAAGSFDAGVWALGSASIPIVDASFDVDRAHGAQGHLVVFGQEFWRTGSEVRFLLAADGWSWTDERSKSKTFMIAYIPVTVEGGVAGEAGLDRAIELTISDPASLCLRSAGLTASFTPYAQLEAFASAAVGTAVAKAGIECGLTLLRLETPLELGVTLGQDATSGKLVLKPRVGASFVVRTLDGRITLFVEIDAGLFELRYGYDVFRWSGLKAEFPLFTSSYDLVLDDFLTFL